MNIVCFYADLRDSGIPGLCIVFPRGGSDVNQRIHLMTAYHVNTELGLGKAEIEAEIEGIAQICRS